MLKAVITTLVLGTSTIAMADAPYPDTYRDDYRSDYHDDYREHRGDRDVRRNRIMLAQNATLGSRDTGALWVPIDARADIARIRVRLASGRTLVRNVTLVYADGHRETQQVERWLTSDQPTLTIDVAHGGVRGMLIDSQQQRRYARGAGWRRTSTATVDVIGLRR